MCIRDSNARKQRASNTPSTAQRKPARTEPQTKASTCRSECNNASKQTELARASTCRRSFPQHAESSKRTKSKSALQKYTSKYNYDCCTSIHTALVWCAKDWSLRVASTSIRYNTALFLSPLHVFRTCLRRPGYPGAWSSWHSQVVSLHLNRGPLCPLHSHFVLYFLVSESEAPCILR